MRIKKKRVLPSNQEVGNLVISRPLQDIKGWAMEGCSPVALSGIICDGAAGDDERNTGAAVLERKA